MKRAHVILGFVALICGGIIFAVNGCGKKESEDEKTDNQASSTGTIYLGNGG